MTFVATRHFACPPTSSSIRYCSILPEGVMRFLLLCFLVCVAGCATFVGPRAPHLTMGMSKRSLDAASSCVVGALNRRFDGRLIHHIVTVDPGQINEVLSQTELTAGHQVYAARLTKVPGGTRIDVFGYSVPAWESLRSVPPECA
jgi:hypothetical protein